MSLALEPLHGKKSTAAPEAATGCFVGPLYSQVANVLRQKVFSFEWEPSRNIPNELQLAEQLNVSVGTVRKALKMLEDERLIRRCRGRGTVVIDAADDSEMDRFVNLYVGTRKLRVNQSAIQTAGGLANELEASKLNIAVGDPVFRIERVMIEPACAIIQETIVVAEKLFPELPAALDRSYRILFPVYRRHYDVFVNDTVESVGPIQAGDAVPATLRLQHNRPALLIERIANAVGIGPVEWTVQYVNPVNASYRVKSH